MEGEWRDATLGDIIELKRGYDLPKRLRTAGAIPLISSGGVSDYHFESKVQGPGVVTGRYGTIGSVFFTPVDFWPLNTTLYVRDFKGNDPKFIYYFLKTLNYQEFSDKAAVPGINRNHLHMASVSVPDTFEQRAIAHILGSLDDKIELNRQMNATLEGMVQALFKSWFVDFDPVIDNALAAGNPIPEELADGAEVRRTALAGGTANREAAKPFPAGFQHTEELGWVPEGWELSSIGDEIEVVGGGTPSTKNQNFWNGIHPFCTPKDMSSLSSLVLTDTERHLTEAGVEKVSSGLLPVGTVVMSSRAPIGYLAISQSPITINQGIIALLKNESYSPIFLLGWLRSNMDGIIERANGSTFLEISKKNFKPMPFLKPAESTLAIYATQGEAIHEKVAAVVSNTIHLTKLRDTLLPKLISGELRIPDAEKLAEEALA